MEASTPNQIKIFLIGMMGSGKSYWTKYLSKKIKTGGYDLDFIIESNEEKTIAEIFAEDGEDYFRQQEAKILRWFKEKKTFVLATGGGTPCFSENIKWMNQQGLTIWIDEPIEELVKRLLGRGATSGRSDDTNETVIRARIQEYHDKTAAVTVL